jgi:hypothetical protein
MNELNRNIRFILEPEEASSPESWGPVIETIHHHRFYHQLEDILDTHGDKMPEAIRSELKNNYQGQLLKQLQLAKELQAICKILNEKELFYINMKGSTLALQLYGKLSERLTRDIDFLIEEKDVARFLELLGGFGYEIIPAEKDKPEEYFRKIKKNYTLISREKNIIIELHWELFSNPYFYPEQSSLKKDPDSQDLNGTPVQVMNQENNFLYLCMHGTYHEYFRLFWLRDIAAVMKNWDLDWENIKKRVESEGLLRIVASSCILSGAVFNIQTPYDTLRKDPVIQWILNHNLRAINRTSQPHPSDRLKRIGYFMKLRSEAVYKYECVAGIGRRFLLRRFG